MENNQVTVQITDTLVKPIIQAKIEAMILSQMPSVEEQLHRIVLGTLSQKVDRDGKPTQYSDGMPMLTWLVTKGMREMIDAVVKEYFAQEQIRNKYKKILTAAIIKEAPAIETIVVGELTKRLKGGY